MDRISQASKAALLVAFCVMVSATPVWADGDTSTTTEKEYCVTEYGGRTECTTETVKEEVTHETTEVVHETVDAGLGDFSFFTLAWVTGFVGAVLLVLSKITYGVRLFE